MKSKSRRLFFALWPAETVRKTVIEAASPLMQDLHGRVMRPHNLHVTLHFIGQVSEDVKECMHAAAQSVTGRSFTLGLDCFGHFPRAKIFWMGTHKMPVELTELHKNLAEALAGCGYKRELRPYNPHLTLMRKCHINVINQQDFSIPWMVNEFVLVESIQDSTGVNYQVLERYPLQ